jgi:hypothetical protein
LRCPVAEHSFEGVIGTEGRGRLEGLGQTVGVVAGVARPWLVGFARFGFAAKGVVQLLIGALALAAAMGERTGRVTDAAGALRAVAGERFGGPVLLLIATGLMGYAAFKLAQGVLDPERRPRNWRTSLLRVGDAVGGIVYVLLAVGTIRLFLGSGAPKSGDARSRYWTNEALSLPYGDALLYLAAAVFVAIAGMFLARGVVIRDVCGDLDVERLGPTGCRAAALLIRVAALVQATLSGTVGWLMFRAAVAHDPAQVRGPGGALRLLFLWQGRFALAVLAIGMLAMGLSSFVEARWRRMVRRD